MVEDVKADPERAYERTLHMFEAVEKVLTYTRSPKVYDRNSRRRNEFHASASKQAIHFWRISLARSSSLEMVSHKGSSKVPPQHPGWANWMMIIPQLPKRGVYRDGPNSEARKRTIQRPE